VPERWGYADLWFPTRYNRNQAHKSSSQGLWFALRYCMPISFLFSEIFAFSENPRRSLLLQYSSIIKKNRCADAQTARAFRFALARQSDAD